MKERINISQLSLADLEKLVRTGGQSARIAFNQLTAYANVGDISARQIVQQLDIDFSNHSLSLPKEQIKSESHIISNIFFSLIMPHYALRAKFLQIKVSHDIAYPPNGSTIEEFTNLSLYQAHRLISKQKRSQKS